MNSLSNEEIIELGSKISVEISKKEAKRLKQIVNKKINDLEKIEDLEKRKISTKNLSSIKWRRPKESENKNNSIITYCTVPSTADSANDLNGINIGIKDNIAVAGVPLTCASEVMSDYVPDRDATLVSRLKECGANITAKTNLDEFANPGHGINGWNGEISNPHHPDFTSGGSSGGSAAAVENGQVDVAIGTDTGGSVRIPASYCGVVGYKPTYGIVPISGIVENTYTKDTPGILAKNLDQTAKVLEAIVGKDKTDPASMQAAGHDKYKIGGYSSEIKNPRIPEEIELVVVKNGFEGPTDECVVNQTKRALNQLRQEGIKITEDYISHYDYGKSIKNSITHSENATHWRDKGAAYRRGGIINQQYQSELAHRSHSSSEKLNLHFKSRLLAGAYLIDNDHGKKYTRAQAARELLREEFAEALGDADALIMPTMPTTAPPLSDCPPDYDYPRNTRHANIIRWPAISLPNGLINGLPIGIQLMSKEFTDKSLISVASTVYNILE